MVAMSSSPESASPALARLHGQTQKYQAQARHKTVPTDQSKFSTPKMKGKPGKKTPAERMMDPSLKKRHGKHHWHSLPLPL